MEFTTVVRKRRSIRRFGPETLPQDALERILDAGTRGPSAGYSQGQSFVIVTESATLTALNEAWEQQEAAYTGTPPTSGPTHASMFYGASTIVIACTNEQDYHRRYQQPDKLLPDGREIPWPVPYWYVDSGCAIMLMLLAAVNEGYDACLIGVPFDVEPWRAILGMPADVLPVGTVLLGKRADDEVRRDLAKRRRPTADYLHYGRW